MNLLKMSFSGAVMITVIVILRALCINRLPKKTFLILWGIVVLRLVIPFQVSSAFSIYSVLPKLEQKQQEEYVQKIRGETAIHHMAASETMVANTDAIEEVAKNDTRVLSLWWIIWLVGVSLSSGFFLTAYRKLYKELSMSLPVENEQIRQWFEKHHGKRSIKIRQSDKVSAPLSYGILHPVILFPKKTDWEKNREIAYILEHEYVHIKRYDSIAKLFVTGVTCLHWFNPLVWVMYLLFNRDLELACDEEVVYRFGGHSRAAYARTLIAMEEQKSRHMPLCNNFSKNAIEERITAIMKMKKISAATTLAAAIMVISVTVVFASSASETKENTAVSLTEDAGGAYIEDTEYSELLKEYEKYGITEKDGVLCYKGEQVRFFLDGYEHENEDEETTMISRYTSFNENGTVDVHTVRDDVKNADGSTTLFGDITDIVPYTQEEFDARDVSAYKNQSKSEKATAAEEGNVETTEQYLEQFKDYGITYQTQNSNTGNIYWNGELIARFWDEKPDGSIFLTESVLSSEVEVHTVYDENGNVSGIAYNTEDTDFDKSASSMEESTVISYEENGDLYYSVDGGQTFLDEAEFEGTYEPLEVEWWTYEEYKTWLEHEKTELQKMLGEKAWTNVRGEFVWTQEIIDETIAQYEEILEEIKNGAQISKAVNGSDADFMIGNYEGSTEQSAENDAIEEKDSDGSVWMQKGRMEEDGTVTYVWSKPSTIAD